MVFKQLLFTVTALEPRSEEIGRVRADLATEKVERVGVPEIDVLLHNFEGDSPQFTNFAVLALLHQICRTLDDAPDARLADEHMIGLFGQHEFASAAQRLKPGFGKCAELIFA